MNGTGGYSYERLMRRNKTLFDVLDKVKLWVSRTGCLHGIKQVRRRGDLVEIETHCGIVVTVRNSKRSRGKRQLEGRYFHTTCKACRVPSWKVERYTKRT